MSTASEGGGFRGLRGRLWVGVEGHFFCVGGGGGGGRSRVYVLFLDWVFHDFGRSAAFGD